MTFDDVNVVKPLMPLMLMDFIFLFIIVFLQKLQMRIDIITVLPELLESPLNYSIVKRAQGEKPCGNKYYQSP